MIFFWFYLVYKSLGLVLKSALAHILELQDEFLVTTLFSVKEHLQSYEYIINYYIKRLFDLQEAICFCLARLCIYIKPIIYDTACGL